MNKLIQAVMVSIPALMTFNITAAEPDGDGPSGLFPEHRPRLERRLESMSPEERQRFREHRRAMRERWQAMTPEEKQRFREHRRALREKFRNLSPEERRALRERFRNATPDERRRIWREHHPRPDAGARLGPGPVPVPAPRIAQNVAGAPR